ETRIEPSGGRVRRSGVDDLSSSLDDWLKRDYPTAYRTACLVLRDPVDAQDAVQEAFLRVWRFRDAIPEGEGRQAGPYRVVVNAMLTDEELEQLLGEAAASFAVPEPEVEAPEQRKRQLPTWWAKAAAAVAVVAVGTALTLGGGGGGGSTAMNADKAAPGVASG